MSSQGELEGEMQELGNNRAQRKHLAARERGRESRSAAGKRLMRDLPEILEKAIAEWIEAAPKRPGPRHNAYAQLSAFDPKVLAVLSLQVVIDSLSQERPYTKTALSIGNRIEDEARFQAYKDQDPEGFSGSLSRTKDYTGYGRRRRHILSAMTRFGLERPTWPEAQRCSVGIVLLELVIQHCGLLEVFKVRMGRMRDQLRIRPTQDALDWVEAVNQRSEQTSPLYLPFVEEPLDWISPMSGGFHSTNVYASALVKTTSQDYLKALTEAEMPQVYSALNVLQRTKWELNVPVFEMFDHLWDNGLSAVGLPQREDEAQPPKPADLATNEEARKEWRKESRAVHDRNNRRKSERMSAGRLNWVCRRYQDTGFWFAHQLDWRGRAYPIGYYLQPQGTDLTKALLQFAEGKPVNTPQALKWHRIHGANCWGLDKSTFQERLDWVIESEQWLRAIAQDPLDCRDWESASSPWQFLAWCMDYVAILDDPQHISKLPVAQDATQSGIQIYSLLLRDSVGASATNCTPSKEPQDLYGLVAARLVDALMQEEEHPELAAWWLDFGIDRACCKRPVMTRVYNATKHSARNYVEEWAKAKAAAEGKALPDRGDISPYWFLTLRLWDAMRGVITSTEVGQDWFSEVASVFCDEGLSIRWTSPLGMPIWQHYPKYKLYYVRTLIGDRHRQSALRTPKAKALDTRRMKAAFAPNVIHSLDAAAMMMTVNLCHEQGITSITCNHDSFATLAADSQQLAEATRRAYVELFTPDLLHELRLELMTQLPRPQVMPELPDYGDLDITQVTESPYFFN